MLERTLQDHVGDLQLTGAVGRNVHEMDAREVSAKKHAELLRLVHRPDVEDEADMRVSWKVVFCDALLGVRHQHLPDVLLHNLMVAPVVLAVRDVNTSCNRSRGAIGVACSGLALEDELQRQQVAMKGGSNARSDLTLVVCTNDLHVFHSFHLVLVCVRGNKVRTSLIHVDDKRRMHLQSA